VSQNYDGPSACASSRRLLADMAYTLCEELDTLPTHLLQPYSGYGVEFLSFLARREGPKGAHEAPKVPHQGAPPMLQKMLSHIYFPNEASGCKAIQSPPLD
jgi:hypothetical protein